MDVTSLARVTLRYFASTLNKGGSGRRLSGKPVIGARCMGKEKSDMGLLQFMKAVRKAETVPSLWRIVQVFARDRDIRRVSYHSVEVKAFGETSFDVVQFGFPETFKRRYLEDRLYLKNPFLSIAAAQIEPFYWSDTPDIVDLSASQQKYLDILKQEGIYNGIAFQVYGPNSRNAVVGVGFHADAARRSKDHVFELQMAAQCAHLQFCTLTSGDRASYQKLSPRELEVLRWIARGKSNSVIASIMGVSRHTVDTITRRMFEKLRVTDRTSAVVRAIRTGLLSHSGDDLL